MGNDVDKSVPLGRNRRHRSEDREIASLAGGLDGVLGIGDLAQVGLTARAAQKRAQNGRLHRIYSGVYSVADPRLLTARGHWRAALLAYGPQATLVGPTAAAHCGIRPSSSSVVHLSVPGRMGRGRPGIRVHDGRTLTEADIELVDDLRYTTFARTLLAIAAQGDELDVRAAVRRAEILRIFDGREIDALLQEANGLPGAPLLRKVHGDPLTDRAKNPFERSVLPFCRIHGLDEPEVNQWITVEDRTLQPDFLWRDRKVILETDGFETHGTRTAFGDDRRRDALMIRNGFIPLRAAYDHLDDELARTLLAVLR